MQLICLKCLAKSPEDRYASALALAEDLERFARGEPLEARPPNLKQRILRWGRRQPALASRLGALSIFYMIEMFNYSTATVDSQFHARMSAIVGVLGGSFYRLPAVPRQPAVVDSGAVRLGHLGQRALFAALLLADGVASPLMIGYPLLIVGSGLWFRVRFVFFMAVLSLISYGVLIVDFYYRRPDDFQKQSDVGVDGHVIFVVGLVIMAMAVAYLVHRLRILSSYCERG